MQAIILFLSEDKNNEMLSLSRSYKTKWITMNKDPLSQVLEEKETWEYAGKFKYLFLWLSRDSKSRWIIVLIFNVLFFSKFSLAVYIILQLM